MVAFQGFFEIVTHLPFLHWVVYPSDEILICPSVHVVTCVPGAKPTEPDLPPLPPELEEEPLELDEPDLPVLLDDEPDDDES